MYRHRQFERLSRHRLAELYSSPHAHDKWPDHVHRVKDTISFAKAHGLHLPGVDLGDSPEDHLHPDLQGGHVQCNHVADLSCGDATIARALCLTPILGDFAPGYEFHGAIEDVISQIPFVQVFVLTETLEHLFDPGMVLDKIRAKTETLLLSTPVHNPGDVDHNPEHYHVWDREGVEAYLTEASFTVKAYKEIHDGVPSHYRYGTWVCR